MARVAVLGVASQPAGSSTLRLPLWDVLIWFVIVRLILGRVVGRSVRFCMLIATGDIPVTLPCWTSPAS